MIITEDYGTRYDGVKLIRTYSDADYYIERDGVLYIEAIDPESEKMAYTETDKAIEKPPFGAVIFDDPSTINEPID